ncbi:hypothetical protein BN946_scf184946.g24 [Trametes cinnabarina]|uniref:Uncharacterized protein n=1 Tax=Pycnoporus cinnabarinus TaxID=5643 RepID=A0A060STA9_PYCCI|nr:hypothetical protein BN946_scf184946.g24 [Trametes cinnabarina]
MPDSAPKPLPSISPAPSINEDIASVWHDDDEPDEPVASSSRTKGNLSPSSSRAGLKGKGKGKAFSRERNASGSEGVEDDEDAADGATEGYPPTKEEEAEARRVAEASVFRSSSHPRLHAPIPPRRPSLTLFAESTPVGDRRTPTAESRACGRVPEAGRRRAGRGTLEDMRTRTGSAFPAPPTPEPENQNPFDTPMASRTSLNIPAQSAIMTESDSIPADFAQAEPGAAKAPGPSRPTLEASSSFANPAAAVAAKKQPPPPPQPLDLPAPRSPPPRTGTPHADKPPEPIPPPRVEPPEPEPEPEREHVVDDGPPVRWWHEWLCGCGEGPDRGGDHQAGRTNPFE